MKSILITALLFTSSYAVANDPVATTNPCAVKQAEIRNELEKAKLNKNTEQIKGLEKALSESLENCTPTNLAAKKSEKVTKLETKVKERTEALKKAEATGKDKKIEKARKKLNEAESQLQEAKEANP
ncbi:DUF1090 domain-containing protein [Bdellovibrio sp. HCB209]|uniref:DUF1090 domain-containing protein n=1 Tax=Bdellovibrio sp. HCB209 TaxID=3394354 RepID=UPI0039B67731